MDITIDKAYKNHISTSESVVVCFDDGSMKAIPKENPMYDTVMGLLAAHKTDEILDAVDVASKITKASNGRFYVLDGLVWIEGESLPDALSKRLIGFVEAGLPTDSLEKFWDNLKANPSLRSREMLYAFLDHNNIPLTEDGCFIAYKRVTADFKDCHTNTFDNSVGTKVTMERAKVDDNPDQTCSSGLHVAAYPYAQGFYSNGHLVEVKVNPFDVVAVPNDYDGQKMRVCAYEVMATCEGPRPDAELLYEYDDTADEDVWDDDADDTRTTDEMAAEYDAEIDATVDDADEDCVSVSVDGRGRVGVPARMIRAIGYSAGETLYADATKGKVTIGADGDRGFVVDKSDCIRVTAYVLDLAGLGRRKNITIDVFDSEITLT